MDKEWVYLDRRSDDYMAGLYAFINNSLLVASFEGKIKCPCVECYNKGWTSPKEVEDHLKVDGMDEDYLNGRWKWHGELLPMANMGDPPQGGADIHAMLHDAFGMHGLSPGDNVDQEDAPLQNLTPDAEKFYRLLEEGKTELYPGCGKTKLDFILQLYQIKAINCWTDVSFTGPEKLQFNAIGQPVGPDKKVSEFARFIGQLAAECTNFPVNAKSWREICKTDKVEEAWVTVTEALDWSDPETLQLQDDIKEVVVDKLHERWKSFKYKLKKKWYKPFRGMEKRFVCENKQVHEGQWRALVTRWDATKNQEVAETNTANRQQLKLHQTTGTKTYAQLRYQWERQHPGEVLDRVKFFALAYDGNKKDLANPQLSNEEAQKKYDKLQELENIVRNEGREVTHEVRNELFNKVMGPEKRNRVRGYGIGAKWVDVPGILTQKSGVTHQLKALSESYEAHRESSEKREQILTQQLKECAEREEAMRADFVQLNKKLDALQAEMVPNPLTQILAADGKASMEKLDLRRLIDLLTKADNLQDMSTSNVEMGNNTSQNCTT